MLLSDEQRMIRDMVGEFARETLAPRVQDDDRCGRFPADLHDALAALNLFGLSLPEDLGGAGLDAFTTVLAIEAVAREHASLACVLAGHSLAAGGALAARRQPPSAVEAWLREMASGSCVAALATATPADHATGGGLRAVAHANGWQLDGSLRAVPAAEVAGLFVVGARDGEGRERWFVLRRQDPGVRVEAPASTLGLRSAGTAALCCEATRVPGARRLHDDALAPRVGWRLARAAVALGLASGATDRALRYAAERTQFDRPLAAFPALQDTLAHMQAETAALRAWLYAVTQALEAGEEVTAESALLAPAATRAASSVCDAAIQVHGGYGYVEEYHVERLYRDAKTCEVGAEAVADLAAEVVARRLPELGARDGGAG